MTRDRVPPAGRVFFLHTVAQKSTGFEMRNPKLTVKFDGKFQ